MTPDQFIAKWKASELKESSAAQSHFNDLCALLDEPTPTDVDPKGEWYCFERGVPESRTLAVEACTVSRCTSPL